MRVRRFGPLHLVSSGLMVGDPGRRHLQLTPDHLLYVDGGILQDRVEWSRIGGVTFAFPTSRFRFPGVVAGAASAALVFLIQGDPHLDPEDGSVEFMVDEERRRLAVSRHHLGGYWEHSISATESLLARLAADPPSRVLLFHPDALLGSVASVARRHGT